MHILETQPINKNFLSQLDFRMVLKRSPYVNFFLQKMAIPQINLPDVPTPNPFVTLPQPGDHIIFEPLAIEFKVDEDFHNYIEIQTWLLGLGFPQEFQQYADLVSKPIVTGETTKSDISLFILNSVKKTNIEVVYVDAFPTSLSRLQFSTTDTDVDYLTAIATFSYTYFTVTRQ